MFTLARKRAILTQFDFGIFCEQNVLSLNVSVDHMMGVEMGKTLEDKYVHTHTKKKHSIESDDPIPANMFSYMNWGQLYHGYVVSWNINLHPISSSKEQQ